jgi:hypothetical protein
MFQTLYDSPWITTFAVSVLGLAGFALWVRRQTFLVAYVSLFTIEILFDALRSGSWSPLAGSRWEDAVGLSIVIVGDYRYFLLVERFACRPDAAPNDPTPARAWVNAFAWSALMPLTSGALMRILPATFDGGRATYLAWELGFIALVAVLSSSVFARRLAPVPAPIRRWLFEVTRFELVTYALWALADIAILAGAVQAGFALRIVPNLLYYGFFLPFVAFRAPREVRG